jgi:branched-chain amino acid transport system ATP-binding protein
MLSIESLRSGYGAIDVLRGLSLQVPDNAIVGVLGANGAGKTALLRAISGLNPVRAGRIALGERDLAGAPPDAVVRSGVIHVPQGRMLFGSMSVRENLELGGYLQRDRGAVAERLHEVYALFPVLQARSDQPAAYLSGGEQQMLALGRALMARPAVLLLDEPSLGLAPKVFDAILGHVQRIHAQGASVLIAEQNARKVLRLADYCYVLDNGTVAFEGRGQDLLRDPRVGQTYLGAGRA